ncbi:MAG TPA: hypothetical protein DEB39_10760 [Planctomycetaceae bacterium]|nr:hypothetical protein [Planctomycetaceae bacterium]
MEFTATPLVIGLIAALCFGMSKTGVPGFGLFGVILMTHAFPGMEKQSTGAVLPLLVIADLLAVFYYIRDCDWSKIRTLALPVLVGLVLGGGVLHLVSNRQFCVLLAAIILAMIAIDRLRPLLQWEQLPKSRRFAWIMGILGGSATVVGNAAGPVMTVYIAAQGFPKEKFMGTFAVFFCLVNVAKLPVVSFLGMITPQTLLFDLCLLPGIVVGSLIGRRLFLLIPEKWFVPIIVVLNTLAALKMLLFP